MARFVFRLLEARHVPPPRDFVETDLDARRQNHVVLDGRQAISKDSPGFALQTLIIMAVSVVLAMMAGVVVVAITTSGNDSLNDAGTNDSLPACAPNEIRDIALEAQGLGGPSSDYQSSNIGCRIYCGTWEFFTKGQNGNGEYLPIDPDDPAAQMASQNLNLGGPDGAGGVYSSNPGCFAPCYWRKVTDEHNRPGSDAIIESDSYLTFDDTNRAPKLGEVRLGVVYTQPTNMDDPEQRITTDYQSFNHAGSPDLNLTPIIHIRANGCRRTVAGITAVGAYTHKPNWQDRIWTNTNPPRKYPNTEYLSTSDHVEVRADPYTKTCTIVDITRNDKIICSSKDDNCSVRAYNHCHMWERHPHCAPTDLSTPI